MPRPAEGLPRSALRPVRQGLRADNIARARELLAVPAPSASRPMLMSPLPTDPRVLRPLSMLRRPHDHHRDLRARLSAKAPHHARSDSDQDRHLMILVATDRKPHSRSLFLLALSRQRPRSRRATGVGRARTINIVIAAFVRRVHSCTHTPCFADKSIGSTTSIQFPQALRRGQIPIAPAAPQLPHFPRFRALALFGRRPQERVDRLVNPASENLRKTGREQMQQMRAVIRSPRRRGRAAPAGLRGRVPWRSLD